MNIENIYIGVPEDDIALCKAVQGFGRYSILQDCIGFLYQLVRVVDITQK